MLALVSFLIIRAAATWHLPYSYSVKVAGGPGHFKFHDGVSVSPIDRGTYSEHSLRRRSRQSIQIRLRRMLAEHPKSFLLLWLFGPGFLGFGFRRVVC